MFHTLLIFIHAGAGVGGLFFGFASLSPPRPEDGKLLLRRLYLLCIAVLLASLVVLIAMDWSTLDAGSRIAFCGLGALGAVMAYRLTRAQQQARAQGVALPGRYVGHIYFTYISLWVGFLIMPALNLPTPQISAPLVVVAVLLTGHVLIGRYQKRPLMA